MYTLIISMTEHSRYYDLKECFKVFFDIVKRKMMEKEVFWKWFDTCWIERDGLYFYSFGEIKDRALDCGWINEEGDWLQ